MTSISFIDSRIYEMLSQPPCNFNSKRSDWRNIGNHFVRSANVSASSLPFPWGNVKWKQWCINPFYKWDSFLRYFMGKTTTCTHEFLLVRMKAIIVKQIQIRRYFWRKHFQQCTSNTFSLRWMRILFIGIFRPLCSMIHTSEIFSIML